MANVKNTARKTAAPKPVVKALTGKRLNAFDRIASDGYDEGMSRTAALKNMGVALGTKPSALEVRAAKEQRVIGRLASQLPSQYRGKEARIKRATIIVTAMSEPAKPGCKPLRKGKVGRRTATEQRLFRNAGQECSQFFAELGLSNAQTQQQTVDKKKAKRAPSMAGSGKGMAAPVIAGKPEPVTPDAFVNHYQTQLAALIAYGKAHAKHCPMEFNVVLDGLAALKQVSNASANAYQVRKAK